MQKRLLVVDDFLPDPLSIISAAKKGSWIKYERGSETELPRAYALKIGRKLNQLKAGNFDWTHAGYMGRVRHTLPSLLKKNYKFKCHFDPGWNALVYLNDGVHTSGGTGFFLHKKTGLEGLMDWVVVNSVLKRLRWSWDDLIESLIADTFTPDKWILTGSIASKFNRLVLFDGLLFHSHLTTSLPKAIQPRLSLNYYGPATVGKQAVNRRKLIEKIYEAKILDRTAGRAAEG